MKKLRWGILSTARINRNVIPAIKASPRCELAAVASRDLAKAQRYALEWQIPHAYGSYEELLQAPDIDIIYNPLPNHLHAEWTIKAAQAGKHVLCEKPIATSVAEVDQIITAAADAGVTVVEAFMFRHHPMNLKVRELIESGALGTVRYVRASFSFELAAAPNIRWLPETAGGSLWDIGCYPVSYTRMVLGQPPLEMYGAQQLSATGVDLSFTGQMRYANGAFAQVECSFALPYYTAVEIRATQGTLKIASPFNPKGGVTSITLQRGDASQELTFHYPLLYLGEVEDLVDVISHGKMPRLPLSESRELIATLTGLRQSAEQNRPLPFTPAGYPI